MDVCLALHVMDIISSKSFQIIIKLNRNFKYLLDKSIFVNNMSNNGLSLVGDQQNEHWNEVSITERILKICSGIINLFMPSTELFTIFLITSRYQCTTVGGVNAGLQHYYIFSLNVRSLNGRKLLNKVY